MRSIEELNWSDIPGGKTPNREMLVNLYWQELTDAERESARLDVCADERTGRRYGRAACRQGRCAKIGGGGRNKNSKTAPYQVWLVW